MVGKAMRFLGVTFRARPTKIDAVKAAGVFIAGTVLSVLLAIWRRRQSMLRSYWTRWGTS